MSKNGSRKERLTQVFGLLANPSIRTVHPIVALACLILC